MFKRIVVITLALLLTFPVTALADFNIYDEQAGDIRVWYFTFESYPEWSDNGGYFEVHYQENPNEDSELYTLRLEGSQGRFYFDDCGYWSFFRKQSNGEPTPGKEHFGFQISSYCDDDQGEGYEKYKNLDPNDIDHWEGASPINDDPSFKKPEPKDRNPEWKDDNGGGDGGDGGDNGDGGDGGNSGDGGGGDVCDCIFESEGWDDFMDKVDDIVENIPPPPNWDEVADTFKDSIVPAVIDDLDNLLGRAPNPPAAPSMPSMPDAPQLEGGVDAPTGNAIPDGGDFTADDIKDGAPEIDFREDPTGGFDILNPVDGLPSQDEFKDNIPNEGDNYAPDVPDPSEGVPAPNPPEKDNPLPSEPDGGTIETPSPPEVEGTAPIPPDTGGNAPLPDDSGGTAPLPDEDTGNAPVPGDTEGSAPLPDEDTGKAPIPGGDFGSFPIPGGGGGNAPIPGDNSGRPPMPGG